MGSSLVDSWFLASATTTKTAATTTKTAGLVYNIRSNTSKNIIKKPHLSAAS
jgi:hypothetical protein